MSSECPKISRFRVSSSIGIENSCINPLLGVFSSFISLDELSIVKISVCISLLIIDKVSSFSLFFRSNRPDDESELS